MKTLQEAFLAKYPQNGKVAEKWAIATGTTFSWESLTRPNMAEFTQFLVSDMARSSARQYCAKLKAVIEIYAEFVDLPKDWRKALTIKDDESQHIYLTEDEIKKIISFAPRTLNEATVQQQFILGCTTGARHSDYSAFTEANVNDMGNLSYVSKKTHIKAELPLSPIAKEILFGNAHSYPGAYLREVTDPTFNDNIREICRMVGITKEIQLYRAGKFWKGQKYEAVSSHTSRRSFCTNLYLRCHDLLLVSKLAGHKDASMTERYVCCGMESMTDKAMGYFKEF